MNPDEQQKNPSFLDLLTPEALKKENQKLWEALKEQSRKNKEPGSCAAGGWAEWEKQQWLADASFPLFKTVKEMSLDFAEEQAEKENSKKSVRHVYQDKGVPLREKIRLVLEFLHTSIGAFIHRQRTEEANEQRIKRLFDVIETSAFIIPSKTKKECFDPVFEEEKEEYLKFRRKNTGRIARIYGAICFGLHTCLFVAQSLLAECSEKTKKVLWAAFGGFVVWYRGH